tara:strand:- start:251 stop:556 length:306 start_codon:yes stop_codon:yes gene_type:complete
MPKSTIIFWRDIPSQVVVKQGRTSAKVQLSKRFMEAIDKAAMRAGRQGSKEYLEDWRRVIETCLGDPKTVANTIAEELEQKYTNDILKAMVKNKGLNINQT